MKISILIVTRKWNSEINHFNYLKELKDNKLDFEVILAEGNNPSSQRNTLARTAEGEYLLFMDDDSLPIATLLERYLSTLQLFPETKILGGPSILMKKDNHLGPLSQIFFFSIFGIGPLRGRYNSYGVIRKASESDLILCNLLIKKDFFLKTKGFSRELYPGEENEFLKEYQGKTDIVYDPEAIVYREPRETFYLFLKQMFSYGKGRSKHLKFNSFFEFLFLIPLFFAVYILIWPFFINQSITFHIPLFLHLFFSCGTLLSQRVHRVTIFQKLHLPIFFLLGHFSYGLGLISGLGKYTILYSFSNKIRPNENIQIHRIKYFKKNNI